MAVNKTIICILFCALAIIVKAQKFDPAKPNVYFGVDTTNTTPNNSLISVKHAGGFVHFEIFCPCFTNHQHPYFISTKEPEIIENKDFNKLTLISLKDFLLKLSIEQENVGYKNNVFFIQKEKGKYYKYFVNMALIQRRE